MPRSNQNLCRKKKGTQYFVTVPIVNAENCRNLFLTSILNFVNDNANQKLLEFCISLEDYENSKQFKFHIHAFLEVKVSFFIDTLKNYLQSNYEQNVDVKACESKKKYTGIHYKA